MKNLFYAALLGIAAIFPATSHAAIKGTVSFIEPTGTVGATDSIVVNARLTLDNDSDPLVFDKSKPNDWLDLVNEQMQSAEPWQSVESFSPNTWFLCSGSFTSSCTDGPPYNFSFSNKLNGTSFSDLAQLNLNPGESIDYEFGIFTPSNGPVAAGDYVFYSAGFSIYFTGYIASSYDAEGNLILDGWGFPINPQTYFLDIGFGCQDGDLSCAFTRTVTPVPEPESYALLGLGLGVIAWNRRRKTVSVA